MRQKCYRCFRPESSCVCSYCEKIETNSHFIILMHPMERQKVKNNTGFITALSLKNSSLYEGIDFSEHKELNKIINSDNNEVYLLYPSTQAKPINEYKQSEKKKYFIIIDATWPCAKKMLKLSKNLHKCIPLTFKDHYTSQYQIKEQPKDGFISTLETAQVILNELNEIKIEEVEAIKIKNLLAPFYRINEYQIECKNDPNRPTYAARLKYNKT